MKKIMVIVYMAVATMACAAEKSVKCPVKKGSEAARLAKRMTQLTKRGYMFGHQDSPFYGLTWAYDRDRSDVKDVCGDYSAVMGFELGGIEMGDEKNLDSVPFNRMREEIVAHHQRGGIVTISWHPRNPLTTIPGGGRAGQVFPAGSAWDVSSDQVVRSVLPGGACHDKFTVWMERVSAFLRSLKTADGKPVPIVFRPWHENTGSWFWWGEKLCTADEYKALWNQLQDKLTADGLTNLLWAYSPGMAADLTETKYLERYPGDDRVSLVGIDGYQWGARADFMNQLNQNLAMLCAFGKKHHKLVALTECGLKNLSEPDWWTTALKPIVDRYPISYLLVWRNDKNEYFGPAKGQPDEPYFVEFYKAPNTLFLKDIAPKGKNSNK